MSNQIKAKYVCGHSKVRVRHNNVTFSYDAPVSQKEIRAKKGRKLSIHIGSWFDSIGSITVNLNGTQINTLKRILQEAGEIS
jgi:hypothetical protein